MPEADWRPTAGRDVLLARARLFAAVREFFAGRGVLEVETPVLGARTVTDPHIDSIAVDPAPGSGSSRRYLQTSPEYAMKRLLAAGSGDIYQIAHAFRADERGRLHNPEFTLLEWYRVGYDHHQLMAEVAELVRSILGTLPVRYLTYAEAFRRFADIDPDQAGLDALRRCAARVMPGAPELGDDRDAWLDLIMGGRVAPALGAEGLDFVYDYPASQAALARPLPERPDRAARFELFISGRELANGFHELADPAEQRRRFERDQVRRSAAGKPVPELDERLLAALGAGLPDCAGVALGLDRLLMLKVGAERIEEVIPFPAERS